MPAFYALVDAVAGQEQVVASGLKGLAGLRSAPCKDGSYDFLVRFEAPAFDKVDDFLQTHVRRLPGVKGVEIVTDWDDYGSHVRDMRAKLDA